MLDFFHMGNAKKKIATLTDVMSAVTILTKDVTELKADNIKMFSRFHDHTVQMETFATRADIIKFKDEIIGHIDGFAGKHKTFETESAATSIGNKRRDERLDRIDKHLGFQPIP